MSLAATEATLGVSVASTSAGLDTTFPWTVTSVGLTKMTTVSRGFFSVIEAGARIAAGSRFGPHCMIGGHVDLAEGCELLDVIEAGRVVGAVAVSIDGNVATLKAAATTGTETYEALGALEVAAKDAGAVLLGMFTRRGALVPLLVARGYRIRSIELEKDL